MTTLTHTLFGIVLAKVSIDMGMIPATSSLIYPISIISANLPDFDVLYVPMSKNHRESLLHTPLFWLAIIGLCYAIAAVNHPLLPYIHILTIGIVSHFLLDTIDMRSGIRWFYPFNKNFINVLHSVDDIQSDNLLRFIKTYVTHPVAVIESVVLFTCIIAYLKL